jgi:hypothetical protein
MNQREYWAVSLALNLGELVCLDLTRVRRRDVTSRVDEDRGIDVANLTIGVAVVEQIDEYRNNRLDTKEVAKDRLRSVLVTYSNYKKVHKSIVCLAGLAH